MSKTEIPEDIAALVRKVGRQFKSEQESADFSRLLKKMALRLRAANSPWMISVAGCLRSLISRPYPWTS